MTARPPIEIRTVSGNPVFAAAMEIEQEMRSVVGMDDVGSLLHHERRSPTSFHVASVAGRPIGVASTTTGQFDHLPLGLALMRAGADLPDQYVLPGPVCELVGFAVDDWGDVADIHGVAEALYRAFYRHARASGASSVAIRLDAWLFDIMRDSYGVPFTLLGPPLDLLGREQLPVGGPIAALEAATKVANPDFHRFLTA